MIHTPHAGSTTEELLLAVYNKDDVSHLELELAQRIEDLIDEVAELKAELSEVYPELRAAKEVEGVPV